MSHEPLRITLDKSLPTVTPTRLFPASIQPISREEWLASADYYERRAQDYETAGLVSVAANMRLFARDCRQSAERAQ